MMSDVTLYFESLKDIEDDQIFITESLDELNTEISSNCWSISMTSKLASLITIENLFYFLDRVKLNRRKQLINSRLNLEMLFYLWFDEQACQLRFNFINSKHRKLPFDCRYILTEEPGEIVELFLSSKCHDGFPFAEFDDISNIEDARLEIPDEDSENNFELKIYSEIIRASRKVSERKCALH